jgi:hypothetical protein
LDTVQIEIAGLLSAKATGAVGIIAVTVLVLAVLSLTRWRWPGRQVPRTKPPDLSSPGTDSGRGSSHTELPAPPRSPARVDGDWRWRGVIGLRHHHALYVAAGVETWVALKPFEQAKFEREFGHRIKSGHLTRLASCIGNKSENLHHALVPP